MEWIDTGWGVSRVEWIGTGGGVSRGGMDRYGMVGGGDDYRKLSLTLQGGF